MEHLKPVVALCEPDPRQSGYTTYEPSLRDFRPITVEDHHSRIREIELHSGVPEEIRSHFETARNLAAFAWFFYPFNVTAQLAAYISVEFALRTRYSVAKHISFKSLVRRAVNEGSVKDTGFSHYQPPPDTSHLPPELQGIYVPRPENEYVNALVEALPYLRNALAHGVTMLHNQGIGSVRTCADFINQLFERPGGGS
jgi:hypothetical protein